MVLQVLVVDDDLVDQEAVRRCLSRPGRDVSIAQAANGMEGIAHLQSDQKFDCVFLDYNLSDMDGVDVLRRLYDPETGLGPAPIVMLTGQVRESAMLDAIHLGAQDYLIKGSMSTDILYIALAKAMGIFDLKRSQLHTEERLRQSQKMEAIGQLTSGVAHDFNNLLAIILGNAYLLHEDVGATASSFSLATSEKIASIEEAAHKGVDLVHRLMAFTRQRPLEQQIVKIGPCIKGLHMLLKRTLGEKIEIKTSIPDDLWPVCIDVGQFENALINLAVNARDAMPDGGYLTIGVVNKVLDQAGLPLDSQLMPGDYILMTVSDTGMGIPKDALLRIFDPFFTTKKIGEGTGLGLSMVYGFILQSNGYVRVESRERVGTEFSIYLPRSLQQEAEVTGDLESSIAPNSPVHETILLVEDNAGLRDVTTITLQRMGYKVISASDGYKALDIIKEHHRDIDLVFTDVMMPGGLNGIEMVRRAREICPQIRALYASGNADIAIERGGIPIGDSLITKPYSKLVLSETLRQSLSRIKDGGVR